MENFRTRIDFTDRQAKQYEITDITLSGKTSFGLPYSSITSGPDLTITGETFSNGILPSTYTGTTGSTTYVFGDARMSIDEGDLVPLTPSNSGNTQYAGPTWAGYDMFTTVDGYTGWTYYSSVTYTIDVLEMADLGSGNYSGNVTSEFIVYSASSLDYTGRTIWACVSGITKTDELIVCKDPTIGYVLTCIDSEGKVAFLPSSGATSGGTDTYVTGSTLEPSNIIRLTSNDTVNIDTDISSLLSGFTTADTYTTGATLNGTTLYFDTTDSLSAYTADLSSLSGGSSGTTFWEETGTSNTALKDIKGGHTISSTSTNSMIAGGNSNTIESSLVSFIGGGAINSITSGSSASGIVGGTGNTINGSTVYSFIGGGQSHTLGPVDVTNSTIIAGSGHTINGGSSGFGDRNGIIGGLGHTISGSTDDNFIGGGRYTYLNSRNSAMLGGENNTLITSENSNIIGGDFNVITSTGNVLGMMATAFSTISGSSSYGAIIGGFDHVISAGTKSLILGGDNNTIGGSASVILGGGSNEIYGSGIIAAGEAALIGSGSSGGIIASNGSDIIGGVSDGFVAASSSSSINGSGNSAIIAGNGNTINSSDSYNAIMAGSANTITGTVRRSAIIGGFDITATADDTVYVPSLNIGTVESGTSVSTLGVSSDGTVISGITKEFFVNPTGISSGIKGSFYSVDTNGNSGESAYMNGSIPDDYSETISIEALVIPDFTASEVTSFDCQYGAIGDQYSATTNSTAIFPSYVVDDFTSLDVSAVFSGVTSGDVFGFEISQGNNESLYVIGLKFKYKAK